MTKSKKAASLGLCLLTVMSTVYAATQSTMPVSASYYASIREDAAEEDEIISVLEELEYYDSYSFWTRPENQTANIPMPANDPEAWWIHPSKNSSSPWSNNPNADDDSVWDIIDTSTVTDISDNETENVTDDEYEYNMVMKSGRLSDLKPSVTTTGAENAKKKKKETKALHLNVYDVSEPSNLTVDHIKDFIATRTEWAGLEEYLISRDDDINLIFLLAVARTETGGGAKCVGDYNCFNIKDGKGHYRDYNSYEESIDHFIRLINTHYIDPDGKYYNGTSIYAIAKNYASDYWGTYVANLAQDLLEDFENVEV